MTPFDILGLGSVAVDDILYVDTFPEADTKLRMQGRERSCGGLVGAALLAASNLGARCAYAGRLGVDAASQVVEEAFCAAGVDTAYAVRAAENAVCESTIIVGTATRTRNVFSSAVGLTGADDWLPDPTLIASAKVLLVDHHGVEGTIRAAKIARDAGVAVVGDFERDEAPRFGELLGLVDHLILSESFARHITGCDPQDAVGRLWTSGRKCTAVTCGADGCWLIPEDGELVHQPAIQVTAIDTAGCGDVFHGAYAFAWTQGMNAPDCIHFATAAAALKASRRGRRTLPRRAEVESLLIS